MDNEEKDTPMESAEDLAAEKEQLGELKEDKVREDVIKEYGFDPEADTERIDKAVKREISHRKALSKAVGQKVKYREGLAAAKPPKTEERPGDGQTSTDDAVSKALDKRDLEEMEYPAELKDVIKRVAELNKTSVKAALKDPYVAAKVDAWKKEKGADEAAISRRDNSSGGGTRADTDLTPPNVDLSTDEGRKAYDKWKADMKAKGH